MAKICDGWDEGVIYQFGDVQLVTDRHEVLVDGAPTKVEPQVFNLLIYLVENRSRVVTKDDLFENVWGGRIVSESTVASQISAARAAIGDSGRAQRLIKTVHSRGFRFVGEVTETNGTSEIDRPVLSSKGEAPLAEQARLPWLDVRMVAVLGAVVMLAGVIAASPFSAPNGDDPRQLEIAKAGESGAADLSAVPAEVEPAASLAVLPFANVSTDEDLTYLADGMTEQVLNALARVDAFRVISRSSSFALLDKELTTAEIAEAFSVSHIVEGSVRSSGETVRINVQLLDTETNTYVWSETFDRPLTAANVLDIEDEIASKVTSALEATLDLHAPEAATRMESLDVFRLYVRGNNLLHESTPESIELAVQAFEECLTLDPGFALAHAGLAFAHTRSIDTLLVPAPDVIDKIRYHLDRGMALAPTRAEILTAAAAFAKFEERRSDALDLAERAVASNPNYALAHGIRAYELLFFGRHDEALEAFDIAVSLDPLNSETMTNYAWTRLTSGDFAGAISVMEANLKWQPNDYNYLTMLGYMNLQAGDLPRAYELYRRAHAINPRDYDVQAGMSMIFLSVGDFDRAAQYSVAVTNTALALIAQGDAQAAYDLMAQSTSPTVWAELDTWLALGDLERAYLAVRDREIERFEQQSDVSGTMAYGMYYTKIALVFRHAGDPLADEMMARADQFYAGRGPTDFAMRNDLIGGALWRLLYDDTDGALEWIDHAVARGDAFLAYVQEPLFDPLVGHQAYDSMMSRMRQNGEIHWLSINELRLTSDG